MGRVWIAPEYTSWFSAGEAGSLDAVVARFAMDLETERHRTQTCQRVLTNDAGMGRAVGERLANSDNTRDV